MISNGNTPLTLVTATEEPGMAFDDVVALLEPLGFRLEGVRGDHRIYRHPQVPQPLALEPEGRKAKPCEVGELLEILDRYDLPGMDGRGLATPQT